MKSEEERKKSSRQMSAYIALPFALAIPAIVGWAIGSWLDRHFDSAPYGMFALIIIGFLAGIREFYRIVTEFRNEEP